ncbi:MAG: transposase [Porticoccaceae bacterium]|jgi:transposase-like protein|nr:transposase [Porticoccaceae bacterium]MBT5577711.1 transposase [Porticoccaceae bacterium]
MSKGKRYTQQFKEEAVKQIVERGYSVSAAYCCSCHFGKALN